MSAVKMGTIEMGVRILLHCNRERSWTPLGLAEALGTSLAVIEQVLDDLEAQGVIGVRYRLVREREPRS